MQNSKPLHTDALTLLAKATSRGLSSETCLGYGWAPRAASTRQPGHKQGASEHVAGGGKKPTEDPPARSQNC